MDSYGYERFSYQDFFLAQTAVCGVQVSTVVHIYTPLSV